MNGRATPRLILYVKAGCHLCEQAEADLRRIQRRRPHTLEVLDITQDSELMARYALRIPVLVVAGREYDAPLDASAIERALVNLNRQHATEPSPHGA